MKRILKALLACALVTAGALSASAYQYSMYPYEIPLDRYGNPVKGATLNCVRAEPGMKLELGKWYTNFEVCKKYADDNGLPLLAVWSNEGCIHCWYCDVVFVQEEFIEWQKNNDAGQVICCFMAGKADNIDQMGSAAYNWMWNGGGKSINAYPFVVMWWQEKGVNVRTDGDSFCVERNMTEKAIPGRVKGAISSLEKAFKDWKAGPGYTGGRFEGDDGKGNAGSIESTNWPKDKIALKILRPEGEEETALKGTNSVTVAFGDSEPVKFGNAIFWDEDETEKTFELDLAGYGLLPGESYSFTVSLFNEADYSKAMSTVALEVSMHPYVGATIEAAANGLRLAAVKGKTSYVDVKLPRLNGGVAATNILQIVTPVEIGGEQAAAETAFVTNVVELAYEADELEKSIRIDIPWHKIGDAGIPTNCAGNVELSLFMADGETAAPITASFGIELVEEPPVSISYPLFVGEKAEAELQYGEWTMDLAAVTNKLANAQTKDYEYVLVNVGGDMWCPHCVGIAESLYADEKFAQWAKENRVYLVTIDQPQGKYGDGNPGSLLSYKVGRNGCNGGFYLSSKMISEEAAAEVLERNRKFSMEEWLLPGVTATRIANPVQLLFNSKFEIVGRLAKYETADRVFPTDENLARLDELVAMAGQAGGLAQESQKDSSTTTFTHDIGGKSASFPIQMNDNLWTWELSNVTAGEVAMTVSAEKIPETDGFDAVPLTVEVYTTTNGTYTGRTTIFRAENCNGAANLFGIPELEENEKLYLRVAADYTGLFLADAAAIPSGAEPSQTPQIAVKSSILNATISTAYRLNPVETKKTHTGRSGDVLSIATVKGVTYRLAGFTGESLKAGFTAVENKPNLYVAATDGAQVALTDNTAEYQVWRPGTVGFVSARQVWMEEDKVVAVKVYRRNDPGAANVSGDVTVTVSLAEGAPSDSRYTFETQTLAWAEGETGEKEVSINLSSVEGFDPTVKFNLVLAVTGGEANLGAITSMENSIADTDKPMAGRSQYKFVFMKNFAVNELLEVFNVKGNGKIYLKSPSGSLPRGVTLKYVRAEGKLYLAGTPTKIGNTTYSFSLGEYRSSAMAEGPRVEMEFSVIDAAAGDADAGVAANASLGKSFKMAVPLFADVEDNKKVLAGVLELAQSSRGKLSASFAGPDRKTLRFSGAWSGYEAKDGTATAKLVRNGATLKLEMKDVDGAAKVKAVLSGAPELFGDTEFEGEGLSAGDFAKYEGYYVTTLPVQIGNDLQAGTEVATGTGYATFRMVGSSFEKTGRVKYAGMLGNGLTYYGTAYLVPAFGKTVLGTENNTLEKETALLPVMARVSGSTAAVAMEVRAEAATDETVETAPMVVLAPEGTPGWWRQSEEIVVGLDVYGGIYDSSRNLETCCDSTYQVENFWLKFDAAHLLNGSWHYGAMPEADAAAFHAPYSVQVVKNRLLVEEAPKGMRLTLNRGTGLVTGSIRLKFGNRTYVASFRGAMLVGWYDCGCMPLLQSIVQRPLMSGTLSFTDRKDGATIRRGVTVDIVPYMTEAGGGGDDESAQGE